jgi:molybdenum cofactor synthesis domain-containing protein
MDDVLFGVITVSDSRSEETDKSGPAIVAGLASLGYKQCECRLVRDEVEDIQAAILELCQSCTVILTTGGTGFGPRDVTPEATGPLLDRSAPGIVELIRLKGLEQTSLAHLSRGVAGLRGQTLIINLAGSPNAARQGVFELRSLLPHIIAQLRGESGHPC